MSLIDTVKDAVGKAVGRMDPSKAMQETTSSAVEDYVQRCGEVGRMACNAAGQAAEMANLYRYYATPLDTSIPTDMLELLEKLG